jgi:hypothetical protein
LGHVFRSASASAAAAAITCSQLSRMRSTRLDRKKAAVASVADCFPCTGTPNAAATASPTSSARSSGANSTNRAPSGKRPSRLAPTRNDRLVLPTPALPTNVTKRYSDNRVSISATSPSRPTNAWASWGRLLWCADAGSACGLSACKPALTAPRAAFAASSLTTNASTGLRCSSDEAGQAPRMPGRGVHAHDPERNEKHRRRPAGTRPGAGLTASPCKSVPSAIASPMLTPTRKRMARSGGCSPSSTGTFCCTATAQRIAPSMLSKIISRESPPVWTILPPRSSIAGSIRLARRARRR